MNRINKLKARSKNWQFLLFGRGIKGEANAESSSFRIVLNSSAWLLLIILTVLVTSCNDKNDETVPLETGTLTDIDNNVYQTIKIGNQWWMAEDLKTNTYSNGVAITNKSDSLSWVTDSSGGWMDSKDNGSIVVGKFYNGFAVANSNKLAPAGWHIPSDEEWKQLEKFLGMSASETDKSAWRGAHEGEKIKSLGNQHWTEFGTVWGTNETGFNALAYGCVLFNAELGDPGVNATGFWWSSTTHAHNNTWYRPLDYKNANIFRSHCSNNYGFRVRCVKD